MNFANAVRACGDVAVIFVFSAVCSLHLAFGPDHGRAGSIVERRVPTDRPATPQTLEGVDQWLRDLEKWFNDHFAFRPQFQSLDAALRIHLFGVSPSDQVVLGEGGWLYYTKDGIFPDRRGHVVVPESELEAWRMELEQRSAALSARGIPYLFCVAPNKVTIYPEHLPTRERQTSGRPTRLDQILAHLEERSKFRILDGRPPLKQAAKTGQAYHATDSHWNEVGAFAFYQSMIERLRKDGLAIEALAPSKFTPSQWPVTGDLGVLIPWLAAPQEAGWFMTPSFELPARKTQDGIDQQSLPTNWGVWDPPALWTCEQGEGTLLFVGDSFQWPLMPWLAAHFRKSYFLSSQASTFEVFQDMVDTLKPTVVIEERAERNMAWPPTRPQ